MVPNDVVFDLLVTWHNEPVSLMIFEEETSENE